MAQLGTLDDLPEDYVESLHELNTTPLWPVLASFLPEGRPNGPSLPAFWSYEKIRPLLIRAGELTPIEKAERRVLVLCNPGHELEHAQATGTIYLGLQLILPGESAPNHRHSPSAIRLIVEGSGGYTSVQGEKLIMEPGDLILTPALEWHEHGHEGSEPVIWLDALDLPLIHKIEAAYMQPGKPQNAGNEPDSSQTQFTRSGLLPYDALNRQPIDYPLRRYPWIEVKTALEKFSQTTPAGQVTHLAYVNPETGEECLPTLGFSALMIRAGETVKFPTRSCSSVFHAIEGAGTALVDGQEISFEQHDTAAAPNHASIEIENRSAEDPLFLFLVDDAPLHRRIKIYQEFQEVK